MRLGSGSAAIACVGALLLCASCGGQRPSEASFRAQVNRICRSLSHQSQAGRDDIAKQLERGLRMAEAAESQFARIRAPKQDERLYRDFLARLHAANSGMRALKPELIALGRGKMTRQRIERLMASLKGPQRQARLMRKDARALGLHACVNPASR